MSYNDGEQIPVGDSYKRNNDPVMINLDNALNRAIVLGNGESRRWLETYSLENWNHDIPTWLCNAIYRDMYVDNLVSVDYAMQQEIYQSDLCQDTMQLHFANWSVIPAEISDMMFMGYDIPEEFIHKTERNGNHTEQCVVSGKDPSTIQESIELVMKDHPNLDPKDLKMKMEKDVGVWITYLRSDDNVKPIDYPREWSAGTTALHLACQVEPKEVYMLGFDLSSYDEPINNIYKGTDNYLSSDAKGFSTVNWLNQMHTVFTEFKGVTFHWVDPIHRKGEVTEDKYNNVSNLTKAGFCDILNIL